jgi:IS30 family transposase
MKKIKITLISRQDIYKMRSEGKSLQDIVDVIGGDKSAVSRELKRNGPQNKTERRALYWVQAKLANDRAEARKNKLRPKRLKLKSVEIQKLVVELITPEETELSNGKKLLLPGLSPKQISKEVPKRLPGMSISHEAIYQWIFSEARELIPYLEKLGVYKRRRKRTEKVGRRKRKTAASPKKHISTRSESAESREEFGHRERDSLVSNRDGKGGLQNIIERKTRFMALSKLNDLSAKSGREATIRSLRDEPPGSVLSIANDHGAEHQEWESVERVLNTEILFCNPYAAQDRGSNERANRTIRKVYPKGTNFQDITDEEVKIVEDWYNNRPLGVIGYRTPREAYEEEISKLKKAA